MGDMGYKGYHLGVLCAVLILVAIGGCGGNQASPDSSPLATSPAATVWPNVLPVDNRQPWEQIDAEGYVIPAASRDVAAINSGSEFVPGVERYAEGGDVSDKGEAATITSESGSLSYAIYRIPVGGEDPGALSVDANLLAGAGYYVGLANYGANRWGWLGPFTDNHLRISVADGDYLSTFGNAFVCLVTWDGAGVDVIGVGLNKVDPDDSTPPPTPLAPALTPVSGGLYLAWLPVAAGDLAGYNIYFSSSNFTSPTQPGVRSIGYLEGATHHLLTGLTEDTFIRLSTVDISGNESALGPEAAGTPLGGSAPGLTLSVSAPSVMLLEEVVLTASGASTYDFDTDGDGVFDVTDDTSGVVSVDTTATGIIRPFVFASGPGEAVACGGVSLIVASNSRPVASALASPTTGKAPLLVIFTGAGSTDFDGEIVGGGWDFDGDGTYDVWDDTDIVHVTGADHTYTTPGLYNAKLRVVDDQGSWDVDTAAILVNPAANPENIAPTADLAARPDPGYAGLRVTLDASGSSDPDGCIVSYEWDFDGNGIYDSYGAADSITHVYSNTGVYSPVVRVTDNVGAQDTASASVCIESQGPVVLETTGNVGRFTSLVLVDDYPAIAYYDFSNSDLMYVRAANTQGSAWGTPIAVDTTGSVGLYTSQAIVDGYPAISYYDETNGDLKYSRATNAHGSVWGTPVAVDTAGAVGSYTSLEVVAGNPAIAYYDESNGDLKYVRATDAQGTAWGTSVSIDSADVVGAHTSLAVVDGCPAICYLDVSNGDLKYVGASDALGIAWETPVAIDTAGMVGWNTSLAIVDGYPAISFYDSTNGDLKYVRAADNQGTAWSTPVAVDTTGYVGSYTSLAIVDGYPAISYYDATNVDLKYVRAADTKGAAWGTPIAVDTTGSVGLHTSLAIVDGYPAISYYDVANGDLKYVIMP